MFGLFRSPSLPEIDAPTLAVRLSRGDCHVLDVREPQEIQSGHIPMALCIPVGQIGARAAELPGDKEIVVVCRSGSRSAVVCRQLRDRGFKAINLRGGMLGWQGPIDKG